MHAHIKIMWHFFTKDRMMLERSGQKNAMDVVLIGAILGGLSIHNYVPQFNLISRALLVSNESVKLSLPAFIFSFAMAQLFYGAISDYYGRRILYMHGMMVFFIGSILCAFSGDTAWFVTGRLVQGFGAGCSLVLGLAILRDVYQKEALLKSSLYFGVTFMMALLAGPFVGGLLSKVLFWKYAYFLMALGSLAVLMAIYFLLPETNFHQHPQDNWKTALTRWLHLFRNRAFVGYLVTVCLVFCVPLIFYSMAPFLLISNHIVSLDMFPWILLATTAGFFLGGLVAFYAVKRIGVNSVIAVGILLWISMSAFGLLLGSQGLLNELSVLLPSALILIAVGMVFVSSLAAGLTTQHSLTGSTAALLGFFIFTVGGLSALISAWLDQKTQIPLLGLVLGLAIVTLINFWLVVPGNLPRSR